MNKSFQYLLVTAWIFSIIGWVAYGRFVYITTIDPDLSIKQYDEKYFGGFPAPLNSVHNYNLATAVVIIFSIILVTVAITMRKKLGLDGTILFIVNGLVLLLIASAYM